MALSAVRILVASLALVGWVTALGASTKASQESVIYSFLGSPDGATPTGSLIADATGALYGTTASGGNSANDGTVFELTRLGSGYTESILDVFDGVDGANPTAGLIFDSKVALYGTTVAGGGGTNCGGSNGCGVAFKLTRAGSGYVERVLHVFNINGDGMDPQAGLVAGAKGALFGTTTYGGGPGYGVVFKLTRVGASYVESVIYQFGGGPDGAMPYGGLLLTKNGELLGTTFEGGEKNRGTVFALSPSRSGYTERIVYRFGGRKGDGAGPLGGLITDARGAIFGATESGGVDDFGCVFKLTRSLGGYKESVIHSFAGPPGDGSLPNGSLHLDASGSLYGTTDVGGLNDKGTVFKLTPSGNSYSKTIPWNFGGANDGADPLAGLIADTSGRSTLYGTTSQGGSAGYGTVFEFTP